jgi:hypothetical protein
MRPQAQKNKIDYSTSDCYYSAHEPAEMGAGHREPAAQYRVSGHGAKRGQVLPEYRVWKGGFQHRTEGEFGDDPLVFYCCECGGSCEHFWRTSFTPRVESLALDGLLGMVAVLDIFDGESFFPVSCAEAQAARLSLIRSSLIPA